MHVPLVPALILYNRIKLYDTVICTFTHPELENCIDISPFDPGGFAIAGWHEQIQRKYIGGGDIWDCSGVPRA